MQFDTLINRLLHEKQTDVINTDNIPVLDNQRELYQTWYQDGRVYGVYRAFAAGEFNLFDNVYEQNTTYKILYSGTDGEQALQAYRRIMKTEILINSDVYPQSIYTAAPLSRLHGKFIVLTNVTYNLFAVDVDTNYYCSVQRQDTPFMDFDF